MRSFVLAALAALTIAPVSTTSATADAWQDRMLGIPRDSAAAVQVWKRRTGRTTSSPRVSQGKPKMANRVTRSKPKVAKRVRRKASVRKTGSSRGTLRGLASYYWQPQRVASGGWFNPNALTAAHKTLPFGTKVRVTNMNNGRSVVVRINDRGPYIAGRIIDLSKRAAHVVGMQGSGVVPVTVAVLNR